MMERLHKWRLAELILTLLSAAVLVTLVKNFTIIALVAGGVGIISLGILTLRVLPVWLKVLVVGVFSFIVANQVGASLAFHASWLKYEAHFPRPDELCRVTPAGQVIANECFRPTEEEILQSARQSFAQKAEVYSYRSNTFKRSVIALVLLAAVVLIWQSALFIKQHPHDGWRRVAILMYPVGIGLMCWSINYHFLVAHEVMLWFIVMIMLPIGMLMVRDIGAWVVTGFTVNKQLHVHPWYGRWLGKH